MKTAATFALAAVLALTAAQGASASRTAYFKVSLVASQDGHFTIFRWSEPERMVHAHRVERLLL